jgi:hypothetical protein
MILTIFDFDDTLFPSSWFTKEKNFTPEIAGKFLSSIKSLFAQAKKVSDIVMIVTCANREWVMYCSELMPGLLEGINILCCPDFNLEEPIEEWKSIIFRMVVNRYFSASQTEKTLIAMGDAMHDRQACLHIRETHPEILVKSILFEATPTYERLLKQQEVVCKHFQNISDHKNPLDLMLYNSSQPSRDGLVPEQEPPAVISG